MAAAGNETRDRLQALLAPAVQAAGFDLEDIAVSRAGNRSVVRITVDRDGGVDLDAVATATRAINEVLDAHEDVIPGAYALEVTSPGVDRPLTAPRHWRRNLGRLVAVTRTDGTAVTGRLRAADEEGATLSLDSGEVAVAFSDVRRAVVQLDFTRPATADSDDPELDSGDLDLDDADLDGPDDTDDDDEKEAQP